MNHYYYTGANSTFRYCFPTCCQTDYTYFHVLFKSWLLNAKLLQNLARHEGYQRAFTLIQCFFLGCNPRWSSSAVPIIYSSNILFSFSLMHCMSATYKASNEEFWTTQHPMGGSPGCYITRVQWPTVTSIPLFFFFHFLRWTMTIAAHMPVNFTWVHCITTRLVHATTAHLHRRSPAHMESVASFVFKHHSHLHVRWLQEEHAPYEQAHEGTAHKPDGRIVSHAHIASRTCAHRSISRTHHVFLGSHC